jgi:hypothetical protein
MFLNFLKNKKYLFSLVFLTFIFFIFPKIAFAQFGWLANLLLAIPYLIISLILIFFVVLTGVLAIFASWLLDLFISPSFISLSFTDPKRNPIIDSGLNITLSLVNLILVLSMVYTALSIALRINEGSARKTLVRLIIVAFLVNFANVFCGLVVDGTNIVMSFFLTPLQEGISGYFGEALSAQIEGVTKYIFQVATRITEAMEAIMIGVVQIAVNIVLAVAFLIFALIFLIRYIAIWILVILAPVAFASWAVSPIGASPERELGFPLTIFISEIARRFAQFWDKWLKEFIEWSIIGIPFAFFLYLALINFHSLVENFRSPKLVPEGSTATAGFFDTVVPYIAIGVFLYLGFAFGLQTAAFGADKIVAGAKAAGGKAAGIGARAVGRAVWGGAKLGFKMPITGIKTFGQGMKSTWKEARKKGESRIVAGMAAIGGGFGAVGEKIAEKTKDWAKRIPEKSEVVGTIIKGVEVGVKGGKEAKERGEKTLKAVGKGILAGIGAVVERIKTAKERETVEKGVIQAVADTIKAGLEAGELIKKKGVKICSKCKASNLPTASFCSNCGNKL